MKGFQYVALSFVSILIVSSARNCVVNRRRPLVPLVWLLTWGGVFAAIAAPDSTTHIANMFGIHRGADFVFYCGVLGGLVGFSIVYLRFRRMDRQLTVLVRELALARAQLERGGETPSSLPSHEAGSSA
jgi:small membrane protein